MVAAVIARSLGPLQERLCVAGRLWSAAMWWWRCLLLWFTGGRVLNTTTRLGRTPICAGTREQGHQQRLYGECPPQAPRARGDSTTCWWQRTLALAHRDSHSVRRWHATTQRCLDDFTRRGKPPSAIQRRHVVVLLLVVLIVRK